MSAVADAAAELAAGRRLPRAALDRAFACMLDAGSSPEETAEFLTALARKGETAEDLAAAVRAMRARSTRVECAGPLVDTCGTGGDKLGTFNVSTAAAFVAAAAGLRVAKHGNRAVSGSVGAADVLEAAGARIDVNAQAAAASLERLGFCFLFAPNFHPALRHVGPVRRALGFPTVFNLAGPLCNPAGVTRQVVGVFSAARLEVVARALLELGTEHALVVHGDQGADEITPTGVAATYEVRAGALERREIDPQELGAKRCSFADLRGGNAAENAAILREVLGGKPGPKADTVALNAGAALYVGGCRESIEAGVEHAREVLASGRALERLEQFVALGHEQGPGAA